MKLTNGLKANRGRPLSRFPAGSGRIETAIFFGHRPSAVVGRGVAGMIRTHFGNFAIAWLSWWIS
jgi:hypothetical protein